MAPTFGVLLTMANGLFLLTRDSAWLDRSALIALVHPLAVVVTVVALIALPSPRKRVDRAGVFFTVLSFLPWFAFFMLVWIEEVWAT